MVRSLHRTFVLATLLMGAALAGPLQAACLLPPGDLTADGTSTVADVQCTLLATLWSLAGQFGPVPACIEAAGAPNVVSDHDCSGVVNVSDVQISVLFALGASLEPELDSDASGCVDACESDLDGDGDFDFTDCAPYDALVRTGAPESCNGWDDDCDGSLEDSEDAEVALSCSDNDVCTGEEACMPPSGAVGLVISELMLQPAAGAAPAEWMELTNGTDSAFNIRGVRMVTGSGQQHVIDPGGALFVPANGRVVLASSAEVATNGGLRANYVYSELSLAGSGGLIELRDFAGNLIDAVDAGSPGFPGEPGASAALVDLSADNFDASSWASSSEVFGAGDRGTPGGPNRDVAIDACVDGAPLDCDDGDACTDDLCDPGTGCDAVPIAGCGGACDPVDPPIYSSNGASYTCSDLIFGFTLVNFNFTNWSFSEAPGGGLAVSGVGGAFPTMTGNMPQCPGGTFSVQSVIPGGCCERFNLTATYLDEDTWEGTFSVGFCGSPACGCPTGDGFSCLFSTCTDQSFAVQGTR